MCCHRVLRLLLGLVSLSLRAENGPLVNQEHQVLLDSHHQPVVLKHNPQATNVTWEEVLVFVQKDDVNRLPYVHGHFVCTEFAKLLHDRAVEQGLRCAFVSLTFEQGEGHALNAFETTDYGLVYVDCTGSARVTDQPDAYDTIGYVEKNKKYGRLPLQVGAPEPNRYQRYEAVTKWWEQLRQYKVSLDQEAQRLQQQARAQQQQSAQLQQKLEKTGAGDGQLMELVRQHNIRAARLQEALQQYNVKVTNFNQLTQLLQAHYQINESPVKRIELWW